MKGCTTLATVILEYLLVTGALQQFSLAAPTLQTNEHAADETAVTAAAASPDFKRGTEYRNVLFGNYLCRVQKAADLVWNKLQVRIINEHFIMQHKIHSCCCYCIIIHICTFIIVV